MGRKEATALVQAGDESRQESAIMAQVGGGPSEKPKAVVQASDEPCQGSTATIQAGGGSNEQPTTTVRGGGDGNADQIGGHRAGEKQLDSG